MLSGLSAAALSSELSHFTQDMPMGVTHVSYQDDFDFRTAISQTQLTNLSTSLSLSVICHSTNCYMSLVGKGMIFLSLVTF